LSALVVAINVITSQVVQPRREMGKARDLISRKSMLVLLLSLIATTLRDENQIKEAFINGGRGHPPSHLKFFLLVFSKLKEDIK